MKKTCEKCHKKFRNLYQYKGFFYCFYCVAKEKKLIINGRNFKFIEPIDKSIDVSISLTQSQYSFLQERMKQLNMRKLEYFRTLLIIDMENVRNI